LVEGQRHFTHRKLLKDILNNTKEKEIFEKCYKLPKMERNLSIESYLYPPVYREVSDEAQLYCLLFYVHLERPKDPGKD
jgi:hypothetical protein